MCLINMWGLLTPRGGWVIVWHVSDQHVRTRLTPRGRWVIVWHVSDQHVKVRFTPRGWWVIVWHVSDQHVKAWFTPRGRWVIVWHVSDQHVRAWFTPRGWWVMKLLMYAGSLRWRIPCCNTSRNPWQPIQLLVNVHVYFMFTLQFAYNARWT